MSALSALMHRFLRLPSPRTQVRVERDIAILMPDGVRLLADRYYPAGHERAPLVLIRTPYGRRGGFGLLARIIAEQGYQVFQQSLRGTADSGGKFDGFLINPDDARVTLTWLRAQPWFPDSMATWGTSYLGYVQWELAGEAIPEWKAAIIQDAPAEVYRSFAYPDGIFGLGAALTWAKVVHTMFRTRGSLLLGSVIGHRKLRKAMMSPAICDSDRAAVGEHVPYFQEWLHHPEFDDYWVRMDHRRNVEHMPPIVLLAGGWYDIFLPGMLDDYNSLRAAGRQALLLVGPWAHGGAMINRTFLHESIAVLDSALRGQGELPALPVRANITGVDRWSEFTEWPPPGCEQVPWYLHAGGGLGPHPPDSSESSRYRYDPTDPTPSVGGAILGTRMSGPKDNRRLEARSDVLVFTSRPLTNGLEVIGSVAAEIHIRSNRVHTDIFVRLCDVAPNGRSTNLSDGIVRLSAKPTTVDGVRVARVELWPVAHMFGAGHRIRVHVSSGAHPRYSRNPGTGEALGTVMQIAEQEVFHDPEHLTAIFLPHVAASHAEPRPQTGSYPG